MIQQIAIGETTGKIYARGTHAECSRRLNRTKQFLKEPIRIVKSTDEYEGLEQQIKRTVPVTSEKKYQRKVSWTTTMNDYITEYRHLSIRELTKNFNEHFNEQATESSVNGRRNGLKNGNVSTHDSNRHLWTQEDDDFVRIHYNTLTVTEIGRRIGRSHQAVSKRTLQLGLREKRVWGVE